MAGMIQMFDMWAFYREIQKMTGEYVKIWMDQYKKVMGFYGSPNKMITEVIKNVWPQGSDKFFDMFDKWFNEQIQLFSKTIEKSVNDYANSIWALEFAAPTTSDYIALAKKRTKKWIDDYMKMKDERIKAYKASLESLKKQLPASVHPILENVNRWVLEQYEKIENDLLERVKSIDARLDSE